MIRNIQNSEVVAVIERAKGRPKMIVPSQQTLDKYGLTAADFRKWLRFQNYQCPICEQTPKTGRWNIDHDHKKNWKKLPPEERKKHVRGLVCWFCNTYYLGRAITIRKAENVTSYLRRYEARNTG